MAKKARKLENCMIAVCFYLGHPATVWTPEIHAVYWNGIIATLVALEL